MIDDRSLGGSITGLVARSAIRGAVPFPFLSFHLEELRPACSRFLCWPGALPPLGQCAGNLAGRHGDVPSCEPRPQVPTRRSCPLRGAIGFYLAIRIISRTVSNDTRDWIPRPWTLGVLGSFLISRSSEVLQGCAVFTGTAVPLRTPDDRVDQYRAVFFVERPEVAVKIVPAAVRYLLFNDTRALKL